MPQCIMLIYGPAEGGPSPDELAAEFPRWGQYTQDLKDAGLFVGGDPLQGIDVATTVRVRDGELVLVATTTADEVLPNTAPLVAHALGVTGAGAFDIGAACTGLLSALSVGTRGSGSTTSTCSSITRPTGGSSRLSASASDCLRIALSIASPSTGTRRLRRCRSRLPTAPARGGCTPETACCWARSVPASDGARPS